MTTTTTKIQSFLSAFMPFNSLYTYLGIKKTKQIRRKDKTHKVTVRYSECAR